MSPHIKPVASKNLANTIKWLLRNQELLSKKAKLSVSPPISPQEQKEEPIPYISPGYFGRLKFEPTKVLVDSQYETSQPDSKVTTGITWNANYKMKLRWTYKQHWAEMKECSTRYFNRGLILGIALTSLVFITYLTI